MFHPFCIYFFHHATNLPARRTHLSRSNFGKSPVIAPRRAGVHYPADRLASPPPKPTPSPAAASPSPSPRLSLPPQRRLAVTSPPRPPGSRSSSPLLALSSRRPRQPGGGAGERSAVPLPLSPPSEARTEQQIECMAADTPRGHKDRCFSVSGNRGSRLRQVVGRLQLTESGSKSRLWLTESVHVDGRLTVLLLCLLPFSPVIAL
jgi:hypothetical protein